MKRITKIDPTIPVKKQKLRVAAYARVSTGSDEQLASLKSQKIHYERYIKARPDWDYVGLYYDEAVTGTKMEKRDGLLRLLADCEKGKIDRIIVKSISRFSRNTVDSIETVRKLHDLGIHFYFEREKLDTGEMESELLLSVLSSLAESESRSISDNQIWSIQKRFMNGTYKIGHPPYGYKNVEGKMVVVPEEAENVRWIFDQVLSGKSSRDVGRELNLRGIPAKKGGQWSDQAVSYIIRNEKYVGDCLFQKKYTDDRFYRHVNYGERTQYYVKNHHEPIVSREVYEAANGIMDANMRSKGLRKDPNQCVKRYAMTGKVFCSECGGKMKRVKSNTTPGFSCILHLKDKNLCTMKPIREDAVKAAFITMMNKLTFARGKILVPYSEMINKCNGINTLERLEQIETLIEDNLERKQQILKFFTKGLLEPAFYEEERMHLDEEEKKLKSEKKLISSYSEDGNEVREPLAELLRYTAKGKMITEFDDALFEKHVDHVIIYSSNKVGFAMKCGPEFKERI